MSLLLRSSLKKVLLSANHKQRGCLQRDAPRLLHQVDAKGRHLVESISDWHVGVSLLLPRLACHIISSYSYIKPSLATLSLLLWFSRPHFPRCRAYGSLSGRVTATLGKSPATSGARHPTRHTDHDIRSISMISPR